jgi:hypothetical protein
MTNDSILTIPEQTVQDVFPTPAVPGRLLNIASASSAAALGGQFPDLQQVRQPAQTDERKGILLVISLCRRRAILSRYNVRSPDQGLAPSTQTARTFPAIRPPCTPSFFYSFLANF